MQQPSDLPQDGQKVRVTVSSALTAVNRGIAVVDGSTFGGCGGAGGGGGVGAKFRKQLSQILSKGDVTLGR